jgi:prepilin-type N-terminal cleavage/methylation domain-containing protein
MRQAGFTLLELLVGLTLMGLLAVLLSDTLRSGLDVGARVEKSGAEARAALRVHDTFHRLVESAFPLRVDDAQGVFLQFRGEARSLTLVAPAGADQPGGLPVHAIALTGDGLMLTSGRRPPRTIASVPEGAAFAYFGPPDRGEPAQWLASWRDRTAFPLLVRLRVPGWPDAVGRLRTREAIR